MSKRILTNADVDFLLKSFREVFVDKIELEDTVRKIVKEETSHLPTRDEFFEETSKIYKKLSDLEDEKDVFVARVSKNSDYIEQIADNIKLSLAD